MLDFPTLCGGSDDNGLYGGYGPHAGTAVSWAQSGGRCYSGSPVSDDPCDLCQCGVMTTDAFCGVESVDDLHEPASTIALVHVGLHVGGVILAGIEHGENLVRAMFTGPKRAEQRLIKE